MSTRSALVSSVRIKLRLALLWLLISAPCLSQTVWFDTEMTAGELVVRDNIENAAGRVLVDIELREDGHDILFSGLWTTMPGPVYGAIAVDARSWSAFIANMDRRSGRWLDIEVGYFDGRKLWSGLFLEDGSGHGYEIRTSNDDDEFQAELQQAWRSGRQVVDVEAYLEDGVTKYAALWVGGPRQPRTSLYYDLSAAELQDLVTPQLPVDPASGTQPIAGMAGRIIDVERYYSTTRRSWRYAAVFSNHTGSSWAVQFNQSLSGFVAANGQYTGGSRRLIDLDVWEAGGDLRYNAVWGQEFKSTNEVDPIPADEDPEPMNPALDLLTTAFEATIPGTNTANGLCGFYARNLQTNQSIGYRAGEPFYLASCSKTAMHYLLWAMDEDGRTDLDGTWLRYTDNASTRRSWFVDDRDTSGALGAGDFGQSIRLDSLDQFMMQASDNSATSMILEQVIGRDRMNRWLAGISGVGRGFGCVTGITDLDRVIMWQGQTGFPNDESYFLIPSWRWEPFFRSGTDTFGDLQAYVGTGNPFPGVNSRAGHDRYFRMGLNSGEPRAFVRMIERFESGGFHANASTVTACRGVLGGSILADIIDGTLSSVSQPASPTPPQVSGKNGGKGSSTWGNRVINDTATMRRQGTTIAMVFFSMYNSRTPTVVRTSWTPQFGYQLYRSLIADLKDRGSAYHAVSATTVHPGDSWWVRTHITNAEGGDAPRYKVRFYLSTDTTIDPSVDYRLGTFVTPDVHPGSSHASVVLALPSFPSDVPEGTYRLGWIIDPDQEVGEWDDTLADNTALYDPLRAGSTVIRVARKFTPDPTIQIR